MTSNLCDKLIARYSKADLTIVEGGDQTEIQNILNKIAQLADKSDSNPDIMELRRRYEELVPRVQMDVAAIIAEERSKATGGRL